MELLKGIVFLFKNELDDRKIVSVFSLPESKSPLLNNLVVN